MKDSIWRTIGDYAYITIGTALTAMSVALFLNPAKLAPGGISGISTIVYYLTGWNLGLIMLVLSIPIYILGILLFGKKYGARTLVSSVLLSLFTMLWNDIFGYQGILDYSRDISYWLSALYGGIISGVGIGIVMRSGSNTGGTDILAQALAKYTHIPQGSALMIVDGIVILGSVFLFKLESALYSVVVVILTSIIIDKFVMMLGTGYAKTIYIISEHLEEIGDYILNDLDRSGTIIEANGLFTRDEKPMLMTVIPNQDIPKLMRLIKKIDPNAFTIIQQTVHVLGEGYKNLSRIANSNDVTQTK